MLPPNPPSDSKILQEAFLRALRTLSTDSLLYASVLGALTLSSANMLPSDTVALISTINNALPESAVRVLLEVGVNELQTILQRIARRELNQEVQIRQEVEDVIRQTGVVCLLTYHDFQRAVAELTQWQKLISYILVDSLSHNHLKLVEHLSEQAMQHQILAESLRKQLQALLAGQGLEERMITPLEQLLIQMEEHLAVSTNPSISVPKLPIRLLFVAACPRDTESVHLKQEEQLIQSLLNANLFAISVIRSASYDDLRAALFKHRPHLIHFAGHGSEEGMLIFEDEDGHVEPAKPETLASLIKIFRRMDPTLYGVVLNACWSGKVAEVLAPYVPVVIGMQGALTDRAAQAFVKALYQLLGQGHDLAVAFEMGCNVLEHHWVGTGKVPRMWPEGNLPPFPWPIAAALPSSSVATSSQHRNIQQAEKELHRRPEKAQDAIVTASGPPRKAESKMHRDRTMNYVKGLQVLKLYLVGEALDEFNVHEAKLLENLGKERLFGATPITQADRAAVIYSLNQLSLEHLGISFNDLCLGVDPDKSD